MCKKVVERRWFDFHTIHPEHRNYELYTSDQSPVNEYYFKEGCFITELHNSDADPTVSIARVVLNQE